MGAGKLREWERNLQLPMPIFRSRARNEERGYGGKNSPALSQCGLIFPPTNLRDDPVLAPGYT